MLGSESKYFHKDKANLDKCVFDMVAYLKMKGYNYDQIAIYIKAFEYFVLNPNDFDGATLVNDLCDIRGLDLDAMLHDHQYIVYFVGGSFSMKYRADKLFMHGIKKKGKNGILYKLGVKNYPAYSRFIGLTISDLFWVPFAIIKRGRMSEKQREDFLKDYVTLLKH